MIQVLASLIGSITGAVIVYFAIVVIERIKDGYWTL
jgi:hypothetical protein